MALSIPSLFPSVPTSFWGSFDDKTNVVCCAILTIAVVVSLAVLVGWNIYLSLSGQTTIEMYFNSSQEEWLSSPYDFGWRRNAIAAWGHPGPFGLYWLNPWGCKRPGDGVTWTTKDDCIV